MNAILIGVSRLVFRFRKYGQVIRAKCDIILIDASNNRAEAKEEYMVVTFTTLIFADFFCLVCL